MNRYYYGGGAAKCKAAIPRTRYIAYSHVCTRLNGRILIDGNGTLMHWRKRNQVISICNFASMDENVCIEFLISLNFPNSYNVAKTKFKKFIIANLIKIIIL